MMQVQREVFETKTTKRSGVTQKERETTKKVESVFRCEKCRAEKKLLCD